VHQNANSSRDRISLSAKRDSDERLPKPPCTSTHQNSPPVPPRPPESPGMNPVSQIRPCMSYSSELCTAWPRSNLQPHRDTAPGRNQGRRFAIVIAVNSWTPSSTPSPSKPTRSTSPLKLRTAGPRRRLPHSEPFPLFLPWLSDLNPTVYIRSLKRNITGQSGPLDLLLI
jgi:hypothetical protein